MVSFVCNDYFGPCVLWIHSVQRGRMSRRYFSRMVSNSMYQFCRVRFLYFHCWGQVDASRVWSCSSGVRLVQGCSGFKVGIFARLSALLSSGMAYIRAFLNAVHVRNVCASVPSGESGPGDSSPQVWGGGKQKGQRRFWYGVREKVFALAPTKGRTLWTATCMGS